MGLGMVFKAEYEVMGVIRLKMRLCDQKLVSSRAIRRYMPQSLALNNVQFYAY